MPNTTSTTTPQVATEVDRLRAENERLRAQLAEAQAGTKAAPSTRPTEPSFGISEGQRAELEMRGKTTSPFTGALQVGSGEPGEDPRVVTTEEFLKAGKADK